MLDIHITLQELGSIAHVLQLKSIEVQENLYQYISLIINSRIAREGFGQKEIPLDVFKDRKVQLSIISDSNEDILKSSAVIDSIIVNVVDKKDRWGIDKVYVKFSNDYTNIFNTLNHIYDLQGSIIGCCNTITMNN